jgi:eukaryotic-like serine/threonine-protein kinase
MLKSKPPQESELLSVEFSLPRIGHPLTKGRTLSDVNEFGDEFREEWQRIRAIFDEVLAAPVDQQTALLEQKCEGNFTLIAELRSLLDAYQAEGVLADSISEVDDVQEDAVGHRRSIGPYELDRVLGRGGMGTVYLAHRADGQFRQELAIKVIDLPLATDLYRKRFRMERQIQAKLTHPFIARLLDGGVSDSGELYLAMEYIDGVSIVRYCKEQQLSLRARLLLFKNVCKAVQYAHQNLVIHRDLKPDNILVVADGTPRLLDFGTAKLLTEFPEDNIEDLTLQGFRSFTPQYASPEQVFGKPISVASDIYSLGVLLFQVLAEAPPYVLKEFNTEEMFRVICTEKPPKPSAIAVSAEKPDADLDSIALMALRKEPEERYLTVAHFAADIQAWLDGRPVMARRGTARYLVGKFARRNKLPLSAAVLLLAAILCGLTGVLWQSHVANRERIKAEANAQELRELSNSFLSEIDESVRDLPGSTPVRQLMINRVLERLDHMAANANKDRLTQLYLANAYIRLGSLQGSPYEQNVGDSPGALASSEKALALAQILKSTYPGDRAVTGMLALAWITKSSILVGAGRSQEAVTAIYPAIDILNGEVRSKDASISEIANAAKAYDLLGNELGEPDTTSMGDYSGALDAYQRSYDLYNRALAIDPNYAQARRAVALHFLQIGYIHLVTDPAKAIPELRRSLACWDAIPAAEKSSVTSRRTILYVTIKLGLAYANVRDYKSAISSYEEARKAVEHSADADPKDSRAQTDVAGVLGWEADTYMDMLNPLFNSRSKEDRQENMQRAIMLLRHTIAVNEKLVTIDPNNKPWVAYLAQKKVLLGTLEQSINDRADGAELAAAGVALMRQTASPADDSIEVFDYATSAMLSVLPMKLRDTHLAVQYGERLVTLTHRANPSYLLLLAQAYHADRQFEKARATAQEGLRLLPPHLPGIPATRCRILLDQVLGLLPR